VLAIGDRAAPQDAVAEAPKRQAMLVAGRMAVDTYELFGQHTNGWNLSVATAAVARCGYRPCDLTKAAMLPVSPQYVT